MEVRGMSSPPKGHSGTRVLHIKEQDDNLMNNRADKTSSGTTTLTSISFTSPQGLTLGAFDRIIK